VGSDTVSYLQGRLATVQAQIAATVGAGVLQYTTTIGTQVIRISLADLRAEEQDIMRRLGRLNGGRFAVARAGRAR